MSKLNQQSTDKANSGGVGTAGVGSHGRHGPRVNDFERANKLQDGGSSQKGKRQPNSQQSRDV
jgi:hypothetical protein